MQMYIYSSSWVGSAHPAAFLVTPLEKAGGVHPTPQGVMPAGESSAKLEGILHQGSKKELILITFVIHHRTVLRIANEPGVTK
jgi:hypothetical protein